MAACAARREVPRTRAAQPAFVMRGSAGACAMMLLFRAAQQCAARRDARYRQSAARYATARADKIARFAITPRTMARYARAL